MVLDYNRDPRSFEDPERRARIRQAAARSHPVLCEGADGTGPVRTVRAACCPHRIRRSTPGDFPAPGPYLPCGRDRPG
jgi:hypothetical protein